MQLLILRLQLLPLRFQLLLSLETSIFAFFFCDIGAGLTGGTLQLSLPQFFLFVLRAAAARGLNRSVLHLGGVSHLWLPTKLAIAVTARPRLLRKPLKNQGKPLKTIEKPRKTIEKPRKTFENPGGSPMLDPAALLPQWGRVAISLLLPF